MTCTDHMYLHKNMNVSRKSVERNSLKPFQTREQNQQETGGSDATASLLKSFWWCNRLVSNRLSRRRFSWVSIDNMRSQVSTEREVRYCAVNQYFTLVWTCLTSRAQQLVGSLVGCSFPNERTADYGYPWLRPSSQARIPELFLSLVLGKSFLSSQRQEFSKRPRHV